MGTKIDRNLPGYAYDAAINSLSNPSNINPYATIADLPLTNSSGTQLLTGGASWSGTGMVFDVTVLTYQIAGVNYTSTATSVTLAVGDPSDPRFDAIVVDEFGVVSVITGTPSSNPITPTIPGEQVLVQYVLVNAGAITPAITDEWVYRESQFGDWQGSPSATGGSPTAVWASPTPSPFSGAACLLATYTAYSNVRYLRFLAPAPISRSTYVGLTLRVYLTQNLNTLPDGQRRPFVWLRGGPSFTSFGIRYLDQHGLNPTLVGVWQQVTIPTVLFTQNPGVTDIRVVDLYLFKNTTTPNTAVNIAYDDIVFQSGFGTSSALPTIDILDNGTVIGSTGKLNFIDGPGTDLTIANDALNNKIDVTIEANGQLQIYNSGPNIGQVLDQNSQNTLIVQDVSTTGDIILPPNSTQPIAIGSVFKVTNSDTGLVNIVPGIGVSLYSLSGLTLVDSPFGVVTLTKIGIDSWLLEGDLV